MTRIAALFLGAAVLVFALGSASGLCEEDDFRLAGFRLELRACQGAACRLVHGSRVPWRSREACDERAQALIAALRSGAVRLPQLAAGTWNLTASCAPVLELRTA